MNPEKFSENQKINHEQFLQELKEKNQKYRFMREINEPRQKEGIPYVLKDAICKQNFTTSAGSKILENYKPVFNATVTERLEKNNAVFYGKTQQDEFGFGTFNTNTAFETPKNPHNPERVVGGSSGGAGAIVAAMNQPVISIGESTGGSITNPAAYNGVIGITPTYGRVSRYGLVDYANSLDKIGVLSDTVPRVAKGLKTIAGEDENDQTTVNKEVPEYDEKLEEKTYKAAIPKQYLELDGLQEEVKENFQKSIQTLKEKGYTVEEVDMPLISADVALPAYYVLAMAEASTNLAKMSGIRYGLELDPEEFEDYNEYFSEVRSKGFGEEAKRRILIGTYTRKAGYRDQYYIKAAKVRRKIIDQYKQTFQEYDIILSPSMPNVAPKIEKAEQMDPTEIYAMDTLTVGPNLAGLPMISVPNGTGKDQMPTGLHIISNHFNEQKVLNTAYTYEQNKSSEEKVNEVKE